MAIATRKPFLSQVARADGANSFTSALACWTTHLWHVPAEGSEDTGGVERTKQLHALTCYIDGHRKPVYSDMLLPRGLIGRLGVVLGCRALLLLHRITFAQVKYVTLCF